MGLDWVLPPRREKDNVGPLDRVAGLETLTALHTGLALAGNAYHGIVIPDCIRCG
jgi:protoporphyrinogen/coproporphyrinogen III oxidase